MPSCSAYLHTMGGVDRSDQNIGAYRIMIRGKKWYYPIFLHLIYLAVTNSFLLYRSSKMGAGIKSHLDLMGFRLEVASFLMGHGMKSKVMPRQISKEQRYDGLNHLVAEAQTNRCAECKKNTSYKCIKCERNLHPKCFVAYHTH